MSLLILFNKPAGVACQFSPADGSATLRDYLPQRDVYPAGRLDADSEGLVVLTADGALQHEITDPRAKRAQRAKTYCVQVEGTATDATLDPLRCGIKLSDFTARPAQARAVDAPPWLWARVPPIRFRRHIPTSWIEIILTEGRNRQVRRMTAAVGLPTLRLIRYAVGEWDLAGLQPGEWRELEVEPAAPSALRYDSARGRRSTFSGRQR